MSINTLNYFYVRKNDDFVNKYKYGFVEGSNENLINRIYDSSSEHSELSKYILIYAYEKSDKYKLYKEIDKIISLIDLEIIFDLEKYIEKTLTYLREIQKYKVISKTKKTNEFIYIQGIEILKNVLEYEFPLFGLKLIKRFNQNELDEINQSCRQSYYFSFDSKFVYLKFSF